MTETVEPVESVEPVEVVFEDAPTDARLVTLTGSASNPMRIYVHGVGQFEIRIGETKALPAEAIECLEHTEGATFEVKE